MTKREKLEYLANTNHIINLLAFSRYCPPGVTAADCEALNCGVCWRVWLIGGKKGLAYVDTDSMKTDLPEDMY